MRISELLTLKQNKYRLNAIRKNRKNVVPFVGAGVSAACGLYTWNQLLDKLASEYLTAAEREQFKNPVDCLNYAEAIVAASGNPDAVMRRIGEIFKEADIHLSKAPYLLVSSFSNNVVTTNYDTILETAAKKFGNAEEFKILLPCLTGQMTAAIQENQRCIMKMHGSIEETSSMIFCKSQYDQFYGKRGDGKDRPLPMFLKTIFSGKSVLFIGCSLAQDRTMDILAQCLGHNKSIKHYAIVELPEDSDEEIRQRNYFASIGIDPIYYPKGDYESVDLLLEYLAEDNSFIKEAKIILNKYLKINHDVDSECDTYNLLITILNESYYNTGAYFPELFEFGREHLDIVSDYEASIEQSEGVMESLYDTCIRMFDLLSRTGIKPAHDIRESLIDCFTNAALRETDIRELLQSKHKIYQPQSLSIDGKSNDELTKLADELNRKIQFENEMGFRHFIDDYNQAVELLDNAYERIELRQRVILCNTIGAWSLYVLNADKPRKYLNLAISTIESLDESEQPYGLLSQCYCNLGLLKAGIDEDYKIAMECAEKDLIYKRKVAINPRLYAGSMGHFALYQKEQDPFAALQTYVDIIRLKRNNIENAGNLRYERDKNVDIRTMKCKLIASWASSVFDIGLLAKDLELYEIADEFITVANEYRYKIVDSVSKDYNDSCNVEAELDVLLYQKQDIQKYINAVKGRVSMDPKLSTAIYHSWYVCALYFYSQKDYATAKHYIRKFYKDYYFKGDVKDARLEVRAKLLESKILLQSELDVKDVQNILNEAIDIIKKRYEDNSFWLIEPYDLYSRIDNRYCNELIKLKRQYVKKRETANIQLNEFVNEVMNMKPSIV